MTVPFEADVVTYEVRGTVAVVTLNRPDYRNAQNSVVTYALDAAFQRAVDDDDVKVIVLAGNGPHFSAGHDLGTPGRDHHVEYENKAAMWWDHVDKPGGDHVSLARWRCTWECAAVGGRSPSPPSPWCRVPASRAASCSRGSAT